MLELSICKFICLRIYRFDTKRIANQPVSVIKLDLIIRFVSLCISHSKSVVLIILTSIRLLFEVERPSAFFMFYSFNANQFTFVLLVKFHPYFSLYNGQNINAFHWHIVIKEMHVAGKQNFAEMLVNRKTTMYVIYYCYKLSGIC